MTMQEKRRGREAIDGPGFVRAVRPPVESAIELEGEAVCPAKMHHARRRRRVFEVYHRCLHIGVRVIGIDHVSLGIDGFEHFAGLGERARACQGQEWNEGGREAMNARQLGLP